MPEPLVPRDIREHVLSLVPQLTLEEKVSLVVGRDMWTTQPIERLGIPSIWMTDGPTGVRRAQQSSAIGMGDSVPATCFPTASLLGATWDVDLVREVGAAIGREAQSQGVDILLGPGVNLKRSPLAGRNFEYIAEDPVLSGKLAAAYISGVQGQGVGTSIKHFAANEQETQRMIIDSVVDERTLREVYLRPFEIAIEEALPWTVMCAYNPLNGTYCAENEELLTGILKNDWGYEGIVMSDWTAVNDRPAGVQAGLHLQMPHGPTAPSVIAAVESGELPEERLDEVVAALLEIVFLAEKNARHDEVAIDLEANQALARKVAAEGMVLLKNDGHILPLDPGFNGTVALIGEFARTPRYQGAGSSQVVPTKVETLLEYLPGLMPAASVKFAPGYGLDDNPGPQAIEEARDLAGRADLAIVVIGLPAEMETEGEDRPYLNLPEAHNALVRSVREVQPNTIVVLVNGTAVSMPWAADVPVILEAWLGGQAAGGAIAEILTGKVNPSGKLSETFPVRIEDTPSYLHFPSDGDGTVRFAEGVFTGHRWYDARRIAPLFPFGHGLSYTTFAYEGLAVDAGNFLVSDTIEVTASVENTGAAAGKEVVQLYVGECSPTLPRPVRELKAFRKVALEPGEDRMLQFTLHWQDFAYWDIGAGGWVMNPGKYEIAIGSSSHDIRLSCTVNLESAHAAEPMIDRLTPLNVAMAHPVSGPMLEPIFSRLPPQLMIFMKETPLGKFVVMGLLPEEHLQEIIGAAGTG
jgi:beta-glucosidase